jgi:hypothetical protein
LTDVVAECLALRRWALSLLTRSATPAEIVAQFPNPSSGAWTLFLATEAFSGALSARLRDAAADLPPQARDSLERSTRAEVQRVMAARAQLAAIDGICDECGIEPIVLKGGVHAVDGGEAFDLGDIDLMLASSDLHALQRAMVDRGGYDLDIPPGFQVGTPRGQLRTSEGIVVELHDELDVGLGIPVLANTHATGSQRLHGRRRLRRLAPPSHLVYCVQHTTTHHPFRRGHLRDLLLIADAMDDCAPDELDSARALLHQGTAATVYEKTLILADAMRSGSPAGSAEDSFRRTAAGKYAMSAWFPNGSASRFAPAIDHVMHFAESTTDARRLIAGHLTKDYASTRSVSPAIARYSAPLAKFVGLAVRTPVRIMTLAKAFAVALVVRANYALRWR